jgi:formate hydrogenlyase subunit 3/multisubunit Na+/H+ antiporter MnhD subunit
MATKAGLIGLIRMSVLPYLDELFLGLGVLTGIAGAALAIIAPEPKRTLAFSSISQVGYILIGVGLGTPAGMMAASLHIFFHGLFKGLLFLSVGHAGIGGKNIYRDEISSIPLMSKLGLIVGSLSIMAIPPFNGYFSKSLLLDASGHGWAWWAILIIGFGTVIYFLELNRVLLFRTDTDGFSTGDLPLFVFTGAVVLSAIAGWIALGGQEMLGLMIPHHLAATFALIPAGGLVVLAFRKKIPDFKTPVSLFNMDNAMISLFTGFLFVVTALVLV